MVGEVLLAYEQHRDEAGGESQDRAATDVAIPT
jgi:hypothetical protein